MGKIVPGLARAIEITTHLSMIFLFVDILKVVKKLG
jgi:hypothetical protein